MPGHNGQDLDSQDGDPHDVKHQQSKSPAVEGEENPFSGNTPGEEYDIDEELEKVGLHGDKQGVKPLDIDGELEEEEL